MLDNISLPELIVFIFGMVLPAGVVAIAWYVRPPLAHQQEFWLQQFKELPSEGWYATPDEIASEPIGGSEVMSTSESTMAVNSTLETPPETLRRSVKVYVLRCEATAIGTARWQLATTILLFNGSDREIILDDMHVRLFERIWKEPEAVEKASLNTHFGDVRLRQDNTIFKDGRNYSIPAGDSRTIRLLLRADRWEGKPQLMTPTEGRLLVVFGLLVDVYAINSDGLERAAIPADRIHVFMSWMTRTGKPLSALDASDIELLTNQGTKEDSAFVDRLAKYLREHRDFHAEPHS